MKPLRTLFSTLVSMAMLPYGVLRYLKTGRTPPRAYQALVHLFCLSGGRLNDAMSWCIGLQARRLVIPQPKGLLGDLGGTKLQARVEQLRERGYVVFPQALPAQTYERLMQFALATPATIRRMDFEAPTVPLRRALFDADNPLAVRYDYPVESLLNNEDVQSLLADASILALTQAYLGARPRADVLSMWWHANFHGQPDSEAAQFFHFDLDRIRWLKIFIYLTDVGPEEGPHTFVEGSHRTGGIPPSMLQKGYVRLSDDEVRGHYGHSKLIEFSAPRGTIIVEDTRGLHKGKPVSGSARLILQLQFSNSLFGADHPKAKIRHVLNAELRRCIAEAPDVYAQYLASL